MPKTSNRYRFEIRNKIRYLIIGEREIDCRKFKGRTATFFNTETGLDIWDRKRIRRITGFLPRYSYPGCGRLEVQL